jgi:hypothetical protein
MEGMTGKLVGAAPGDHLAFTYREEASVVENAGLFLVAGLRNGEDARILATPPHLEGIRSYLDRLGVDAARLRRAGRLQELDASAIAEDLLSRPSDPSVEEFRSWILAVLGPEIDRPLRVYGEVVGLLVAGGKPDLALALEKAWNAVGKERDLAILCGYPAAGFRRGLTSAPARLLAAEHSCMPPL